VEEQHLCGKFYIYQHRSRNILRTPDLFMSVLASVGGVGAIRPLKPERSEAYRAWIRTHACIICGVPAHARAIEAAHTDVLGGRGLGQKASDKSCVPLCRKDHTMGQYSYHALGE